MRVVARHPAPADPDEVIGIVLAGIIDGTELGAIAAQLEPLHPPRNTFPAEVLLELAADAIEASGASRTDPIDTERIRQRLLPEDRADTRASRYKVEFAIRAAAMIRAGVDPALLDHTGGWSGDDLWFWSLEALIVYVRAAAEHTGTTPAEICHQIADRHGVVLGPPPP